MSTDADIGYGTLFKSGSPLVTFAEVTGLTPPSIARDSVDASHEESPEAWREFIPGMKDGGEVSFEFNSIPNGPSAAVLAAELDLEGQDAVLPRQILFRSGAYWSFNAFLTGWETDAPLDDKMSGTATFKITGKPTLVQV